jgi:iron complex transport system ATP-binding protein
LEARKGDLVGVLGPNGSGKTTLLRAISGFLKPQQGCVYVEDSDIARLGPRDIAQRVSVVGQTSVFEFPFSVNEYVLFGREPHVAPFRGYSAKDRELAQEAMRWTGVLDLGARPVTELSGGEQRRVLVARALAQEPRVLLLDEPTQGLDVNYQVQVMALLRSLAREKHVAVVAVLHDINLASSYCDHVVLMKEGRIWAAGAPASAITSESLSAVYGSPITVSLETGRPFVWPVVPAPATGDGASMQQVFVIGGGGTAQRLLEALVVGRFRVVAGVLNVGDADWLLCRSLGVETVDEEPFSPVSAQRVEDAKRRARLSCAVMLSEVPFGPGNLRNLEILDDALAAGRPVAVMGTQEFAARDYTNGQAKQALERAVGLGARRLSDEAQAVDFLRRCVEWARRSS